MWPLSRGRQAAAGAALVMLAAVLTFTTAYGDGRASSDAMPVTAGGAPVLSFAIASSAALDGELMAGEVVDLVVPDASVPVTGARVAIDDAKVLRVTERDQMVTLTVAVRDESAAGAVVGALRVPGVTVVRNARPVS